MRSTIVWFGLADLPGLILNTVLRIICELGDSYVVKPGLGGMTAYPPMAMATVGIMLEAEHMAYHKMVGISSSNHIMAANMHEDCTWCHRPENRTRKISIRATCYNIKLVARSHAKDGRLTQDQIITLVE